MHAYATLRASIFPLFMWRTIMVQRGRPAKILTPSDLDALLDSLQKIPFLKKNQRHALQLLQQQDRNFDEKQLAVLKIADRQNTQYQQRKLLIEQIKLKEKNKQTLLANEIEILQLLEKEQDQDTFFRLDRALESYRKIEKAALENRIRLENEHKRDILNKTNKELTEAQKKRNAENQLKYALGGIVLSIWKHAQWDIDPNNVETVEHRIKNSFRTATKIRNSALFQEAIAMTQDSKEASRLFFLALNALPTYNINQEDFHKVLLKKVRKSQ